MMKTPSKILFLLITFLGACASHQTNRSVASDQSEESIRALWENVKDREIHLSIQGTPADSELNADFVVSFEEAYPLKATDLGIAKLNVMAISKNKKAREKMVLNPNLARRTFTPAVIRQEGSRQVLEFTVFEQLLPHQVIEKPAADLSHAEKYARFIGDRHCAPTIFEKILLTVDDVLENEVSIQAKAISYKRLSCDAPADPVSVYPVTAKLQKNRGDTLNEILLEFVKPGK
jgi:hypothetical protein